MRRHKLPLSRIPEGIVSYQSLGLYTAAGKTAAETAVAEMSAE